MQFKSETYPGENVLPQDDLCKYQFQHGGQHGDQKRRAIDFILSKNTHRLDRVAKEPGNRVLFCLQGRPDKAFLREELMDITEDTEVPPEWKWQVKGDFLKGGNCTSGQAADN